MQYIDQKFDVHSKKPATKTYSNELIDEFVGIYGKDALDDIYNKLIKYDILEKFSDVIDDINKLFEFSVHYGLLKIVKYLYEYKEAKFYHDILNTYRPNFNTNMDKNAQTIESGSSRNTSLNVAIWDNFTVDRQECVRYLVYMKRYSRYSYKNKKFIYQYNKKK
uniref:Uncharacterized protein n=1 Tax=Mimivirus LCMiAC01 TaxID=2506608 RepID=A0A481YZV6_9VIRU|nr:MAG: hypothetical protein LCMiAC01_04650 [Mimivirus LCMiAC01]